jgi:hypothetical protein
MTTKLRRFVGVTIVQPVEVATHLRQLTDPRLLPTRCRLFRRSRVLVVAEVDHMVAVVAIDKSLECLSEKLVNHRIHLWFKIGGPIRLPADLKIWYILHSHISLLITSFDDCFSGEGETGQEMLTLKRGAIGRLRTYP